MLVSHFIVTGGFENNGVSSGAKRPRSLLLRTDAILDAASDNGTYTILYFNLRQDLGPVYKQSQVNYYEAEQV